MKNNWRIYLTGKGLGGYRPFLEWVKKNMKLRTDRNGYQFIFVNDLLPYKGKMVGTNIHNSNYLNISTWFNSKLIAFKEADKFVEMLLTGEELNDRQRKVISEDYPMYDHMNQLWLYDSKVDERRKWLSSVGLEDWAELAYID